MSLSENEKNLLSYALFDGAFSGNTQAQNGQIAAKPVTPQLSQQIRALPDEDVRKILRVYQVNKVAMTNGRADRATQEAQSLKALAQEINACVIEPPPIA